MAIAPLSVPTKERAHELIDLLSPGQIPGVVGMLEAMLGTVSGTLANAPWDDEPVTEEDLSDIAEARAAICRGEVFSNEEVLAGFGLTVEDFERMALTPLEPNEAGG